ncbi:unnamed protein product [Soboliphyme baturini]|uniref:PH domain-containing protein n=1 Tax=Soboliphyme baturini TaxID=241478 RepID=A0A183J691_9BILA|nr:unnamed protein product [Soboliphyme baturini]
MYRSGYVEVLSHSLRYSARAAFVSLPFRVEEVNFKTNEARALMNSVAEHIEAGLQETDNVQKILALQHRIQGRYEIFQPGRKLIKEGEILKHSRKEIQPRYLLLFSDVLLYCAPVVSGSSLLRIRNEIPLISLGEPYIPDNESCDGEFYLRSDRRSYILLAKYVFERLRRSAEQYICQIATITPIRTAASEMNGWMLSDVQLLSSRIDTCHSLHLLAFKMQGCI